MNLIWTRAHSLGLGTLAALLGSCASPGLFDDLVMERTSPSPATPMVDRAKPLGMKVSSPAVTTVPGPTSSPTQSLSACLDTALAMNPKTRAAWERARAKAQAVSAADGAYLPQLWLQGTFFGLQDFAPAIPERANWTGNQEIGSVNLQWLLVDFGRRDADSARARRLLDAANADFDRSIQTVVFTVQQSYFNLDAQEALRRAAQLDLENARLQLEATEQMLALGLATRPQVLEMRQDFARARYELEAAAAAVYDAKSDLLVAMGMPPTTTLNIESLDAQPLPEGLELRVDEVIAQALADRPDIAGALARVRAAEQAVARADAEFMPTLSLQGMYGLAEQDFDVTQGSQSATNSGSSSLWQFGLAGQWLLFDGWIRAAKVEEARAQQRAASSDLEDLRLQASGEVWSSYFAVLATRRQFEAAQAMQAAAQDSYDAVFQSYVNGLMTSTDLLASEAALFDARSSVIQSRSDLLTAAARLAYSAGAQQTGG